MVEAKDFCGTVIHATLRSQDLVPAFLGELDRLVELEKDEDTRRDLSQRITTLHSDYEDVIAAMLTGEEDEDDEFLIEDLFNLLNEFGPENFYFGANEGDGADFGWWSVEEED